MSLPECLEEVFRVKACGGGSGIGVVTLNRCCAIRSTYIVGVCSLSLDKTLLHSCWCMTGTHICVNGSLSARRVLETFISVAYS